MTEEFFQEPAVSPERKRKENPSVNESLPNYFFAGVWMRGFAFILDTLCISAVTSILLGVPFNLLQLDKTDEITSLYGALGIVVYLLYFILLTRLNDGQTIGKMVFGLKVVSLDGKKLTWATVIVREGACRFILRNPFLFLGYLVAIFTPNKQHLGDLFSDTSVVTLNIVKAYDEGGFHESDQFSQEL